jgi:hypothetical protein
MFIYPLGSASQLRRNSAAHRPYREIRSLDTVRVLLLIPCHREVLTGWIRACKTGRCLGSTSMLRGALGWRRIKPERSRVRIIWWTDGGVTPAAPLPVQPVCGSLSGRPTGQPDKGYHRACGRREVPTRPRGARQIHQRVLTRRKSEGNSGGEFALRTPRAPTVLRKVQSRSREKTPWNERLRKSVRNGRSSEVWRKRALENRSSRFPRGRSQQLFG